jgi:hypothetical protein
MKLLSIESPSLPLPNGLYPSNDEQAFEGHLVVEEEEDYNNKRRGRRMVETVLRTRA